MSEFRQRAIEDVARELRITHKDSVGWVEHRIAEPSTVEERAVAYAVAQRERVLELEAAVLWALGYEMKDGSFRSREPGEGAYWWRDELQERAKVTPPRPSHEA